MKPCLLTALKVSGPDALKFLQGHCTCDVATLPQRQPRLTACCNLKGRVLANFWLSADGKNFYLILPTSMISLLKKHLQQYAIFSKVNFESVPPPELVYPQAPCPVWVLEKTSLQFTPQMIDLDQYEGVSFTKGCYLGQEVIARTHYLGQLKRHLYRFTLSEPSEILVGECLHDVNEQKMGLVMAPTQNENEGLAVIEDRAITQVLFYHEIEISKIRRNSG